MKRNEKTSLTGDQGDQRRKLDDELKELRKNLRDCDREKDRLHREGMKVDGNERTIFFQKAVTYTNEIANIRRKINALSKRLKHL